MTACAFCLLAGSPAWGEVTADMAFPDWIVDATDRVRCTSGFACSVNLQSWTTAWGCYSETIGGATFAYTRCQVFVTGDAIATVAPNAPCALTMINGLTVSFVSGVNPYVGGMWHQSATFVATESSAVGTTKYHVTMHGGSGYDSQSVGAGSMYGEFDLTFPSPGVLRTNCKSAAPGTLIPTLNDAENRFDGTVVDLAMDSVQ